jgi:hypothetical protein
MVTPLHSTADVGLGRHHRAPIRIIIYISNLGEMWTKRKTFIVFFFFFFFLAKIRRIVKLEKKRVKIQPQPEEATHTFLLLEINKIPILAGSPNNLKLFDFEQIVENFGTFQQLRTNSGRFSLLG